MPGGLFSQLTKCVIDFKWHEYDSGIGCRPPGGILFFIFPPSFHHIAKSSSHHHNLISTIMGCRDQWEMCPGMPGPTSNNASYYTHCARYCAPSHNRHHPRSIFRSFYGVLICSYVLSRPLCGYAPTQRRHLSVTHKRLCSFHPRLVRKSGS